MVPLTFRYAIAFPSESTPNTQCIEFDYRVLYRGKPNLEPISRHKTLEEARAAVQRYEDADRRRGR